MSAPQREQFLKKFRGPLRLIADAQRNTGTLNKPKPITNPRSRRLLGGDEDGDGRGRGPTAEPVVKRLLGG